MSKMDLNTQMQLIENAPKDVPIEFYQAKPAKMDRYATNEEILAEKPELYHFSDDPGLQWEWGELMKLRNQIGITTKDIVRAQSEQKSGRRVTDSSDRTGGYSSGPRGVTVHGGTKSGHSVSESSEQGETHGTSNERSENRRTFFEALNSLYDRNRAYVRDARAQETAERNNAKITSIEDKLNNRQQYETYLRAREKAQAAGDKEAVSAYDAKIDALEKFK